VNLGIKRFVRRKWPMWFVANISSMPSGLRVALRSGLTVWTMNPDAKALSVRTSGNGLRLQVEQGVVTDFEWSVQAIGRQGRQISSENRTLPALLIRRSIVGTSFQLRTSAPAFLTELRNDKSTAVHGCRWQGIAHGGCRCIPEPLLSSVRPGSGSAVIVRQEPQRWCIQGQAC
jgi:hypothetical protein